MQQAPRRTVTWSFVTTLAAIGGAAAIVGVLFGWWQVAGYRESEIFGRELVEDQIAAGTVHWTGIASLVAGLVIVGLALASLVVNSDGIRRNAGVAAVVGGFLLLGFALLGLVQADAVAASQVGGSLTAEGSAAGGLFMSAAGGAVALASGLLWRRTEL